MVELVAGHRGDGGAGLSAAGWSHQVPHNLRAVRGTAGLVALLHHTDDDEDQDEDNDDAEGDDEDEDAGGLLSVGGEGVVSLSVAREDPQVGGLVVEAPGTVGHKADVEAGVLLP